MEFLDATYYARGEPLAVMADDAGSPFFFPGAVSILVCLRFFVSATFSVEFIIIPHWVSVGLAVLLLTIVIWHR